MTINKYTLRQWIFAWLLFLLLVAIGIGVIGYIFTLPNEITAALIAFTGSVIALIVTRQYERKRDIEQDIRKQKTPLYEEFLTFILYNILGSSQRGAPSPTPQEIADFFYKWTPRILMWGSDEVVLAYQRWRALFQPQASNQSTEASSALQLIALEQLMFTLRVDVGHKNKGLTHYDLLALFINDAEEMRKKYPIGNTKGAK